MFMLMIFFYELLLMCAVQEMNCSLTAQHRNSNTPRASKPLLVSQNYWSMDQLQYDRLTQFE